MSGTDRTAVTNEQAEAFGIGRTLGEISTAVGHVASDVREVKSTTAGMAADVTAVRLEVGQLRTRGDGWDREIRDLKTVAATHVTRDEHELLRAEVASARLTWGKLIGGAAAIGGVIIAGGSILLTLANYLGVFTR
jgi:hypothetical protein